MTVRILVFVVGLLVTAAAGAQLCASDPTQEVPFCSFEAGDPPTGWGVADGVAARSSTSRSGSYSMQGTSDFGPSGQDFSTYSGCFPLTATASYGIGAWVQLESGTVDSGCYVLFSKSVDASCAGKEGFDQTATVLPPSGSWGLVEGTVSTVGFASGSILVWCESMANFVVLADDVFAGPDLTVPVTLQGFEIE